MVRGRFFVYVARVPKPTTEPTSPLQNVSARDVARGALADDAVLIRNTRLGWLMLGAQVPHKAIKATNQIVRRSINLKLPPGLSYQSREVWEAIKGMPGPKRRQASGDVAVIELDAVSPHVLKAAIRETIDAPTLRRLSGLVKSDELAGLIEAQLSEVVGSQGVAATARNLQRAHNRA